MEWAGREKHMGGIPRKMVFLAVGTFAKAVATLLNTTSVHNADTLIRLVRSRPPDIPLLTVSNHMSTWVLLPWILLSSLLCLIRYDSYFHLLCSLDDPLLWGFKGFPSLDANLARWVLSAEDICFKNYALTYFFRLGMPPFSFPSLLSLFYLSVFLTKTIFSYHITSLSVRLYC